MAKWTNRHVVERSLMSRPDMSRYQAQARIVKALAHPTRLFVVDELSRRSRCVCELTEMAGIDVSTMSRHLSVLKAAGVVRDEKKGLQVFYHLKTPCVLRIFECALSATRSTAKEALAAAGGR